MPGHRIERINEDVTRELTHIFRSVKDPRVKDCLLSIVRVDVTSDLSYCSVFVSTMEGMDRTNQAVEGLKSAAGYIRRELGASLKLRHTPQLIFKATNAIEYGADISRKLQDLYIDKETRGDDEENTNGETHD